MPELPEVEVVRLGISPYVIKQAVVDVIVRHLHLRFPIPYQLKKILIGQPIQEIQRRGKYLLFLFPHGTLILHLGMSGSLRVLTKATLPKKHDHVDILLSSHHCLRYNDPRRFGAILWTDQHYLKHPLLVSLGPEPLSPQLTSNYLLAKAKKKKTPVKSFLMNSQVLVGVGNIYANEALYRAGIHPSTPAGKINKSQWQNLCRIIKAVLRKAIKQGGTTLKDFVNSDGKPGYFKHHLLAYGKAGTPCTKCGVIFEEIRITQRTTVFCPRCQKKPPVEQ
jgi:formamidopyrimidine-DNA glycosylase